MATTRKTAIKTAVTATKTAALAGAAKTDALNLSKPTSPVGRVVSSKIVKPSKVTTASFNPSDKAIKAAAKPLKPGKAISFAADAKGVPGKSAKVVAVKKAAALPKVDKRRETPQIKIGKVVIERPARKKSDAFDSVPTISVKSGADTIKVFSKLPKGFSWLTDNGTSTKDTLMVYNKHGVHIADVRIERK